MNFFKATAYLEPSIKRFLIALLLVFHPLWLSAAEPWVYVTNNRKDLNSDFKGANEHSFRVWRIKNFVSG